MKCNYLIILVLTAAFFEACFSFLFFITSVIKTKNLHRPITSVLMLEQHKSLIYYRNMRVLSFKKYDLGINDTQKCSL